MTFKTRDEAVALAQTIEHEPRFTCEIVNLGKGRKTEYRIFGVDSYRQENMAGDWFFIYFMVDSPEFWAEYRQKVREHEAARA